MLNSTFSTQHLGKLRPVNPFVAFYRSTVRMLLLRFHHLRLLLSVLAVLQLCCSARAELRLPALFSDHMVLQRRQPCPIWGWDDPGARVSVEFAGQHLYTTTGNDGRWSVTLAPMEAQPQPQTLLVEGSSRREVRDVLVGEVWLCSGQSNMGFTLDREQNGALEILAANNAQLRFIRVPIKGTQTPTDDFNGHWEPSSPDAAARFSAVGYFF